MKYLFPLIVALLSNLYLQAQKKPVRGLRKIDQNKVNKLPPAKANKQFFSSADYKKASSEEKLAYSKQIYLANNLKQAKPSYEIVTTRQIDMKDVRQARKGGGDSASTKYIAPANHEFAPDSEHPARECQPPGTIAFAFMSSELAYTQTSMQGALYLGQVFDMNELLGAGVMRHKALPMKECLVSVGTLGTFNTVDELLEEGSSFTTVRELMSQSRNEINSLNFGAARTEFSMVNAFSKSLVNASLGFHFSDVIGNAANVSGTLAMGSQKNSYCAAYQQEYFRSTIIPSSADGLLFDRSAFPAADANNRNLVYVSEIIYGRMGFINLETDSTYFDSRNKVDGTYTDGIMKISGDVSLDMLRVDRSASMTSTLYGGSEGNSFARNKQEFLNWTASTGNIPFAVVIGYKLNFVDDGMPASILTYGRAPLQICRPVAAPDKYDVEITCAQIECAKAVDWITDPDDEIYGGVYLSKYVIRKDGRNVSRSVAYRFWRAFSNDPTSFRTGSKLNINSSYMIRDLDFSDLVNLKATLNVRFADEEGDDSPLYENNDIKYDPCAGCDIHNDYVFDFSSYRTDIESILKGNNAFLDIREQGGGQDKTLRLVCRENKDDNGSATMAAVFKIKVYHK